MSDGCVVSWFEVMLVEMKNVCPPIEMAALKNFENMFAIGPVHVSVCMFLYMPSRFEKVPLDPGYADVLQHRAWAKKPNGLSALRSTSWSIFATRRAPELRSYWLQVARTRPSICVCAYAGREHQWLWRYKPWYSASGNFVTCKCWEASGWICHWIYYRI